MAAASYLFGTLFRHFVILSSLRAGASFFFVSVVLRLFKSINFVENGFENLWVVSFTAHPGLCDRVESRTVRECKYQCGVYSMPNIEYGPPECCLDYEMGF